MTHRIHLVSPMLRGNLFVLDFARRIPDLPFGFALCEDRSVLGHLLFLERRR